MIATRRVHLHPFPALRVRAWARSVHRKRVLTYSSGASTCSLHCIESKGMGTQCAQETSANLLKRCQHMLIALH